jgi:hypothetical protein
MRTTTPGPEGDPSTAAALYLSGLDHESLHSDDELLQAIAEATAALDDPGELLPRYVDSLLGPGAAREETRRLRRSWALRMARDLARAGVPRTGIAAPRREPDTSAGDTAAADGTAPRTAS